METTNTTTISDNAEVKANIDNIDNTDIKIKENDDVNLKLIGNNNNVSAIDNYDVKLEVTGDNNIIITNNHNVELNMEMICSFFKICSRCQMVKPKDQFYKNRNAKDGLQNYCKNCYRVYMRKYMNDKVYSDKTSMKYQTQKMRVSLARGNSLSYLTEYLGCTNHFFFNWLQFQRSLSPEPIVNEEQDHVLPIKHFKDKPHICWFWINIKPVSQYVNRSKSGTLDLNLFYQQIQNSQYFLENYHFTSEEEKNKVINLWNKIVAEFFILVNIPKGQS